MRKTWLALLFAAVIVLGGCGGPAYTFHGTPYNPVIPAPALEGLQEGNTPFNLKDLPQKVKLVFFGYTSCPDVCPTTLSIVKSAKNQLGDDGDRVDLAMVSVDPARDTAEIMPKYVSSFVPGGHALRSDDPAQLAAAASAFGVTYSVTTAADGTIEVTHTGAMFAVDDAGEVVLTWPFGVTTDDVLGDLRILLAARG